MGSTVTSDAAANTAAKKISVLYCMAVGGAWYSKLDVYGKRKSDV
jgi:hypothetical protein